MQISREDPNDLLKSEAAKRVEGLGYPSWCLCVLSLLLYAMFNTPADKLSLFSLFHLTQAWAVMYFCCDDNEISCDDKRVEADKCILGSFRALRRSPVLWDTIFRRPFRLQAVTSLFFLDLAPYLILDEFHLILPHQTCSFAAPPPSFSMLTMSIIQINLLIPSRW